MKNNEYNKVKVTNENVKNTPEFVGAPKTDSAAYIETVKPYKDELNSRRVNNDKVEEIGVNSKKKGAYARQDYKKVQHGPTHLASTAGHTVVAATTISVTAIAVAVIGTTIIDEYVEELDPIVYLESNISTDSIDFRFTMPSRLLRYNQEDEGPETEPEYYDETRVRAMVYNDNYMDDQEIMEFSEYPDDPENYVEGWMGFYELTPNTNYTLCIYLQHVRTNPEGTGDEVLGIDKLSYRTFSTKPIPSNLITFTSVSADSTSVSFEFRVHPSTLGVEVDPYYQPDPQSLALFAEITDSSGSYYDSLMIENISTERESEYLICYGNFSGLHPSTNYTIKIMQSREQEYAFLGQTTFTTNTSIGHFETIEAKATSLTVPLVVPNEYANDGQSPAGGSVYVTIADIGGTSDTQYIQQWSTFDANNMIGVVEFSGLYPNTYYELEAYYSMDNDTTLLAATSVYTAESSAGFTGITINGTTSFYSHQFDVRLNYSDDGTVYSNFALTFKDNTWNTLGTIELQPTTDSQTVEVGQDASQGSIAYDFDLGQVSYYSLSVYNNELRQTELLVDDTAFTFTDTDQTQFNGEGLYSPFKAQVQMTTGDQCVMPVRLDFVDDAHIWGEYFTIDVEYNSQVVMTAQLERTTDWQYAEFTGQSITSYLGQEFDIYINDANGNPQLNSSNQVIEAATENEVFDVNLLDLENGTIVFNENDTEFDYKAYYLYPDSSVTMYLVFQDTTVTTDEFIFSMNIATYPSAQSGYNLLDAVYDGPTGSQYGSYSEIANTYGNRTFNVYVRYLPQSGGSEVNKLLYEGITFTFE